MAIIYSEDTGELKGEGIKGAGQPFLATPFHCHGEAGSLCGKYKMYDHEKQ
jgi:hypothetical protein